MRWNKPEKENDFLGLNLYKKYQQVKDIFVFGAGYLGRKTKEQLDIFGCNIKFIDNDQKKQQEGYCGCEVYSLERYLKEGQEGIIILAVNPKNTVEIAEQLEKEGLVSEYDFYKYEEWNAKGFCIFVAYCLNKSFMELAQICVTERCTLKCKKCAHGCYAVKNNAKDLSIEQVVNSADNFFKYVDYITEFVLIGGEPLLYTDLVKAVEYIGENYRSQIGIFSITTNGTILPSEELLEVCKRYDITFRISNYSGQVSWLREKYIKIITLLVDNSIKYTISEEEHEWMDYGFESVNRGENPEILEQVFDACKTPCREVRENRLYFCVMARSVSDNLGFEIGQSDYLDFDELSKYEYPKRVLLEFNQGYSEKGYLEMCNHCNGAEAINYIIPAAEQL